QHRHIKSSNRHNWNNFYLVNKKIFSVFDFNEFANDIEKRITERIEETYKFNFKSYLTSFFINSNTDILIPVSQIAEKILGNEFEKFLDLEDNITFSRNSPKSVYEYAYEA